MTGTASEQSFEGPYKDLLKELVSLIEWVQTEHDKSYVKAGDNKVYAYGGNGFVLVLDESGLDGLVEMVTPKGSVSIKPADNGKIEVTAAADGEPADQVLRHGIDGLRS